MTTTNGSPEFVGLYIKRKIFKESEVKNNGFIRAPGPLLHQVEWDMKIEFNTNISVVVT